MRAWHIRWKWRPKYRAGTRRSCTWRLNSVVHLKYILENGLLRMRECKPATLIKKVAKSCPKEHHMNRRRFIIASAAAAVAGLPASAQVAYPSRAITIVNAFPPGGINDIVTRPLATGMEAALKQPVVVETKAGAAGQVGAQFVASTKPDGY